MDQAYSRRVFSPIEASVREASDRETSSKPASNHKASRISAKAASRKTPLILEKSTVKRNFKLPYRASNTRVSKATSARRLSNLPHPLEAIRLASSLRICSSLAPTSVRQISEGLSQSQPRIGSYVAWTGICRSWVELCGLRPGCLLHVVDGMCI